MQDDSYKRKRGYGLEEQVILISDGGWNPAPTVGHTLAIG